MDKLPIVERLRELADDYNEDTTEKAADLIDELVAALEEIDEWSKAYPLSVFPEPDFDKAHKVLTEAGMTLDAISASNMRHVVEGVGKIARAVLAKAKP